MDVQFAQSNTAARIRAAAARGTLSHALIISGAGDRLSAAKYAAAAMECTAAGKPCLACANCRKVIGDIHPDVSYVRDPEHAELSVDTIRAMRTDAFIRPNEGARKVYIFEDCSLLNEKDQNILLKLVEEGPPYAAFLFCTENAAELLQTIRSRCAEIKLPPREDGQSLSENAGALCSLIADGSAARRTKLFTSLELGKLSREELGTLCAECRAVCAAALLGLYGEPAPAAYAAPAAQLAQRLTKAQILGTIELFETYRKHCDYNVGVGPTLGGLAVELEEIL